MATVGMESVPVFVPISVGSTPLPPRPASPAWKDNGKKPMNASVMKSVDATAAMIVAATEIEMTTPSPHHHTPTTTPPPPPVGVAASAEVVIIPTESPPTPTVTLTPTFVPISPTSTDNTVVEAIQTNGDVVVDATVETSPRRDSISHAV
jgi:hypothetical protein